jgi:hypothetical protein
MIAADKLEQAKPPSKTGKINQSTLENFMSTSLVSGGKDQHNYTPTTSISQYKNWHS